MFTDPTAADGRKDLNKDPPPSHNRRWIAPGRNQPPAAQETQGTSGSAPSSSLIGTAHAHPTLGAKQISGSSQSSSASSPYNRRPGFNPDGSKICYDISSYKFVPDDEKRIDILLKKIHGDHDYCDDSAGSKIVHNLPTVFSSDVTGVPADQAPGAQAKWDDARFITVPDFASAPPEAAALHPITRRDTIPFVLLSREAGAKGARWGISASACCKDFINDSLCELFGQDINCAEVYDRTGSWGLATLVYLRAQDANLMDQFRRHFAMWQYLGLDFDTYPKDVIVARPELHILLKDSMKTFKIEVLPKVLFSRNKDVLAGSIRILATRTFNSDEKSKKGEAKGNWRQIDIKGDDQILRCLRAFPESTPFLLGVDKVQIRGGLRPPEPTFSLTPARQKRVWEGLRQGEHPPLVASSSAASSSDSSGWPGRGSTPKRGRPDRRGRGGAGRGRGRRP